MISYDFDRNGVVLVQYLELNHQALPKIARSNAGRVETLNDFQSPLNFLEGMLTAFANFFERDRNLAAIFVDGEQITILVEIADDRMAGEPYRFFNRGEAQL